MKMYCPVYIDYSVVKNPCETEGKEDAAEDVEQWHLFWIECKEDEPDIHLDWPRISYLEASDAKDQVQEYLISDELKHHYENFGLTPEINEEVEAVTIGLREEFARYTYRRRPDSMLWMVSALIGNVTNFCQL